MRKSILKILSVIVLILCIGLLLNSSVTTKQCINYQCHTTRITLFLKLLDFFDRHYNYKQLAKDIVKDAKSDEERVIRLLAWIQSNIVKVPEGFPIIDDHVWHIIIRGYGTDDQSQDVFTTLCNYAKMDAFFCEIKSESNREKKPLSFVKIEKGWSVFDAYRGVYFKNLKGKIADVKDLVAGNWQAFSVSNNIDIPDYYRDYFKNLETINYENWRFSRPAIQSPLRRFISWVINKNPKKFVFDK